MEISTPLKRILDCGVIAIIRSSSADGLLEAAEAIVAGGINVIEYTLTTPDALRLVSAARERLGARALVGAGTVLDAGDAKMALTAGAQFIVLPALNSGAVEAAQNAGVPVIPGAYTPTEIVTAWRWGVDLVKLFPASAGGPAYLKAIGGPLPQVRLVPTGGVSAANAGDYIRAGAVAVAAGGNLADQTVIKEKAFNLLSAAASELLEEVRRAQVEKLS